jgi:hypothetical protein
MSCSQSRSEDYGCHARNHAMMKATVSYRPFVGPTVLADPAPNLEESRKGDQGMGLANRGGFRPEMVAGAEAGRIRPERAIGALALLLVVAMIARPVLSRCTSNIGSVYLSRALSRLPDEADTIAATHGLGFRTWPSPAELRGISLALPATSADPLALRNAERWLQLALQLDTVNGSAHRGMGWIRATQGELQAAALEWRLGGLEAADFHAYARAADYSELPELAIRYRALAGAFDLLGAEP